MSGLPLTHAPGESGVTQAPPRRGRAGEQPGHTAAAPVEPTLRPDDSTPVALPSVAAQVVDLPVVQVPAVDVTAVGMAGGAEAWTRPSWDDVVRTHSDRVFRLAYRLTGNRHDAEDLTQDVFVRVFRSLADYTPGSFEGWLHRITTNLFLDSVRRKAKIRFDALPDDTERLAGREPSPESVLHDGALDPDVEAALSALPPDFRAAVVLCDIEQLSYEEIAATLGVKLGTVRSRIHRGRSLLREALASRAPQPASAPATPDGTAP